MSSEMWQRIRAVRKHLGLSQEEFGARLEEIGAGLGVSKGAVAQWESRLPANRTVPELPRLQAISKLSGAPLNEFLLDDSFDLNQEWWTFVALIDQAERSQLGRAESDRVPVVGTAQLGDDGFWHEFEYPTGFGDGYVKYPMKDANGYALRVKGDSMRPRLKHGEFVVVSPNSPTHPGDEVAVRLRDGRVMVKVFDWRRNGACQFSSINEDHKPMTFQVEEIEFIHLVAGTVRPSQYYPENT